MRNKYAEVLYMKVPVLIRLDVEYIDKIRQLRELGFSPSEIMRQAASRALEEKFGMAKKMVK